jgi:hypothetical protein
MGRKAGEQVEIHAITDVINVLDYGIIVTDRLDLKQNTQVDGYTSYYEGVGQVAYGATLPDGSVNAGHYVKIGTTSTLDDMILLHQNVTITGDVLVGVGGDVDEIIKETPVGGSSTGSWYNLPEPWNFDPNLLIITVPESIPTSPDIDNDDFSAESYVLIDNSSGLEPYKRYNRIDIPSSSDGTTYRLVVLGNVEIHVTDDIDIGQGSVIYVGGDPLADPPVPYVPSSLKIFLDGDIRAGNSNGINNLSEVPANFRLIGTGTNVQDWDIANGGDFFGVYYGPNADITIYAKGEVYGSVSGKSFEFKVASGAGASDYGMHYDEALSYLSEFDVGFGIGRWWEKVVP